MCIWNIDMKTQILIILFIIGFGFNSYGEKPNINKNMTIQEAGLLHQIEIGMSLSDLDSNRIQYRNDGKMPASENESYIVEKFCAEFELKNDRIIRIWFYSAKYGSTNINLLLNNEEIRLSEITANKIIESYGYVKIFEEKHPNTTDNIAYWDKFDPFNLKYSTIAYPKMPYLFMFDEKNKLTCITVHQ